MLFQIIVFLFPISTLQFRSNDFLICGSDRINELMMDGVKMNESFKHGCDDELNVVHVTRDTKKIDVEITSKKGQSSLFVWSLSGIYDSERWRCKSKNTLMDAPQVVKYYKLINSSYKMPSINSMIISNQSNLRCFIELIGSGDEKVSKRSKRDNPILPISLRDAKSNGGHRLNMLLNTNENSSKKDESLHINRPAPNMSKLWGFTTGFILELMIGSLICWRYGKYWRKNNTTAILGQQMYKLLSEPGKNGSKNKELKKLLIGFNDASSDETITKDAKTSDYSTSSATSSSVTTETSESSGPHSASLPSSSSSTTTTITSTQDDEYTPPVRPLSSISSEMLSSVKLKPTKKEVKKKSRIQDELEKRRLALAEDEDDEDDDSYDDDRPAIDKKYYRPSYEHNSHTKQTEPHNFIPDSPLSTISSEMLASVKLKPTKTQRAKRNTSMPMNKTPVFEKLKEVIPHKYQSFELSEDNNEDWNNGNLRKKIRRHI